MNNIPHYLILSNCCAFLDKRDNDLEIFNCLVERNNLSKNQLEQLKSKISNITTNDIARVLNVALLNDNFYQLLITHDESKQYKISDIIYEIACNNVAIQLKKDRDIKLEIFYCKSNDEIKNLEKLLSGIELDLFIKTLSIAFLRHSDDVSKLVTQNLHSLY